MSRFYIESTLNPTGGPVATGSSIKECLENYIELLAESDLQLNSVIEMGRAINGTPRIGFSYKIGPVVMLGSELMSCTVGAKFSFIEAANAFNDIKKES